MAMTRPARIEAGTARRRSSTVTARQSARAISSRGGDDGDGSTTIRSRTASERMARASGAIAASVTSTSAWSSRAIELIPMTPHFE